MNDEELERAAALAAAICIELESIRDSHGNDGGYNAWRFLVEIKDQTGYCWNCGYPLGPTGYCTCTMDD